MAQILLNVKVNDLASQQIEKIKTSLQGIQVPKTSIANTAQLEKSYANLFNTIKNSKGAYPEDVFKGVSNEVQKNLQSIKQLNSSFEKNKTLTQSEKNEYLRLKNALNQLSAQFATTRAETNKLEKTNKLAIPSVDNLRKRYADLLNTIQSTSKNYKKGTFDSIKTRAQGYLDELKNLDSASANYAENVNVLDKNLNQLSAEFSETRQSATNFHGSLKDIVGGFLKFQVAAMIVMKPLQLIRDTWTSINDTLVKTEDAVVALQRVLNDDSLTDNEISGKLYDLAIKYGQTFENANAIAQNFARTGMDWNETIKATEAGLLALNVAELDATEASDGMIAIMQQFGYEAKDLTDIIDILNKTADNYAVTTNKLLTAIQRTGSSAKNANLTLEETVGIVTALSEATGRSGENLGTAVNSLIQFSQKSSALDTFSKLSNNMAKIVEDFRHGQGTILDIWEGLSTEIQNTKGDSEGILSGLFGDDDWRSLNEELQEALGENFAKVTEIYDTTSTFRKNYFIALLNNMDTVKEAIDTANESVGYSAKENIKYMDTYTAKVTALNSKWEKLANNEKGLLGLKKTLVNIASSLLDTLNAIGGIKGALQTVIAIASPFLAKWAITFGAKGIAAIKTFFTALKAGAISANAALGVLGIALGAIVTIINAIDSKNARNIAEDIQGAADSLTAVSDAFDNIDKNADKIKESLKNINSVLSNDTSTTEQVSAAKNDLLDIQNKLIANNKNYAGTIDFVNSSYEKQLGILNDLSEFQRRQAVSTWIKENQTGINAADGYLNSTYTGWRFNDYSSIYGESDFSQWLKSHGYDTYKHSTIFDNGAIENAGHIITSIFGDETDQTALKLDNKTKEEVEEILNELYTQAKLEGQSDFAEIISQELAYLNNDTTKDAKKLLYGDETSSNWIERLTQEQREQYANGKLSWEEIKKILGLVDDKTSGQVDRTKSWNEQLKEVVSDYKDILDLINEARNIEQDITDLEEKKVALEEKRIELQKAQQALEDAKNNRNVKVFNASTGEWELQADRSAIYDAEEKVRQAEKNIENAEKSVEGATWKVLENEIKQGNMTAGDIYEKVKEIAADFPSLAKTIRDAFVKQGYKMPEYDSGGVLRGLGGIKATSQDEVILPPNIAKQILQPSTNAEFTQFAKSLGLLFGSSKQIADMKSGMVVNNGGSTSTDNRSYIANGVPFSRETAETHTLAELFEMAAMYQN